MSGHPTRTGDRRRCSPDGSPRRRTRVTSEVAGTTWREGATTRRTGGGFATAAVAGLAGRADGAGCGGASADAAAARPPRTARVSAPSSRSSSPGMTRGSG